MPMAPLRPCLAKGCGVLVRSGKCDAHGGPQPSHRWDTDRRPDVKRWTGDWLVKARQRLFQREPLCRMCSLQGRLTLATVRDHIVNLADGGTEDESNEQPLCQRCHDTKTQEESRRARA
jgi:5-methylcytosine-specific restriction enzyme A